ncbi:hypothetical protein [Pseudoflavitalea rhizosphaerae]|uniref:hypothetical protein n=1 Tax=Pseudoflavitalea rhizosphaerae TaxID=1884793 RepID=UPI000F8E65F0|nr:hypothetical protein [Pseudoflavitalea rhizosphaerae]
MNTICQHCGSTMQSQRATKKYCSEQCKQQAFYLRTGLQLNTAGSVPVHPIPLEDDELGPEPLESDTIEVRRPLPVSEPSYQPEFSDLLERVIEYTNTHPAHELFSEPEKHWTYLGRESANWVNLRWRSILEALLHYSKLSSVKAGRLIAVTDALQEMQQSSEFRYLPASYPFVKEIRELSNRMTSITAGMKSKESVQYRITLPRKAIIIGMRFLLAGVVPLVPFDQLSFDQ